MENKLIICGPCTFASYKEIKNIANSLKKRNIEYIRAGAFKARTDPNFFQGLGDEGMEILLRVKNKTGLKLVVELMTIDQVKRYGDKIDIIQVGSRNMYNYELLKAIGKINTPVLLKRAFSATYNEWLKAAEYITQQGNDQVILCERGIRAATIGETRNVLDLQAVPYIKKHSQLPIIIDPSHASGLSYMVEPMSLAAIACGADGLIIEVHDNPKKSLCDANQTIDFEVLDNILCKIRDDR